jgi:hypothetical protein
MKSFQLVLTDNQIKQLRRAASNAGLSVSEFVRRILIERDVISDDEIKRGGYRGKDKEKNKKT